MARLKKNNAEYFTHDADMRNDVRVKALRRKFGHAGYAVWCFMLEVLTDSDFFEVEWNDLNVELLAADFDMEADNLREITDYCVKIELFQLSDEKLYSDTHKKRLESVVNYREKQSDNGKKGGNPNFKKGQPNPYYTPEKDNPNITDGNVGANDKTPKDKHSRVEYSRVEESKEDRDNKLSLSVACATDKERDRFFEIFFFRNFVNPAAEVERFVSNYEASGWIRSNGQLAKNREALAKAWAEEPKNREAKRRFTDEFLFKWEVLYGQTKKEGKLDAGVLLRGICGAHFEDEGNTLRLAVTPELARMLKGSWDVYFVRFFDKYYPGKQIKWWAVK